jgi:hypothetical protein
MRIARIATAPSNDGLDAIQSVQGASLDSQIGIAHGRGGDVIERIKSRQRGRRGDVQGRPTDGLSGYAMNAEKARPRVSGAGPTLGRQRKAYGSVCSGIALS